MTESQEVRKVYSTEILSNSATIRVSTEIDLFLYFKLYDERTANCGRHYSDELQQSKQTLGTS